MHDFLGSQQHVIIDSLSSECVSESIKFRLNARSVSINVIKSSFWNGKQDHVLHFNALYHLIRLQLMEWISIAIKLDVADRAVCLLSGEKIWRVLDTLKLLTRPEKLEWNDNHTLDLQVLALTLTLRKNQNEKEAVNETRSRLNSYCNM